MWVLLLFSYAISVFSLLFTYTSSRSVMRTYDSWLKAHGRHIEATSGEVASLWRCGRVLAAQIERLKNNA